MPVFIASPTVQVQVAGRFFEPSVIGGPSRSSRGIVSSARSGTRIETDVRMLHRSLHLGACAFPYAFAVTSRRCGSRGHAMMCHSGPGLNEPATPAVTTLKPFMNHMPAWPLSFCHRMSDNELPL